MKLVAIEDLRKPGESGSEKNKQKGQNHRQLQSTSEYCHTKAGMCFTISDTAAANAEGM